MTEITCTGLVKDRLAPSWATQVPTRSWLNAYGWIEDYQVRVPDAVGNAALSIALIQAGNHWCCVAQLSSIAQPASEAFFEFSVLGFIQLWNSHSRAVLPAGIQLDRLSTSVREPVLFRHPALMPMEISFNEQGEEFERSIIYCVSDMSEFLSEQGV